MAQLGGTLHTYAESVRREDILDEIKDVSPDQNYLTTTLSDVSVSQTLHQWPEYYLSRPSDNSAKTVEGDDNTYSDLTVATMRTNIAQIVKKTFAVSETEIVVDKVSPKDAYARELSNAMRGWKNAAEFAVLRGTEASGGSGVARETAGFIRMTGALGGALFTARASGTSLTETLFNNDFLYTSWNVTDEYVADLLLMAGLVKGDVTKFTAGNTRNIAADDKRLINALSIYESNYGIHELRAHKDMPAGSILGLKKELCHVGYLRKPKHVANSTTGDNRKGHIVGELLAQADSSKSHIYMSGLRAGM